MLSHPVAVVAGWLVVAVAADQALAAAYRALVARLEAVVVVALVVLVDLVAGAVIVLADLAEVGAAVPPPEDLRGAQAAQWQVAVAVAL